MINFERYRLFLKSTWLVLICFGLNNNLNAQNNILLKGKVLDQQGLIVSGATVSLASLPNKTVSNSQGDFNIRISNYGKYIIEIKAVGYQNINKEINITPK